VRWSIRTLPPALLLLVLSATPAGAATTCAFNPGTDAVTVTMSTPDVVEISQAGGFLQVNSGPSGDPVFCTQGPAPMDGIDTITVRDTSGGDSTLTLEQAERFRPGDDPEPDGTSEIEFGIDLGTGAGDRLVVEADIGEVDNSFRFGTAGANFNDDADSDATLAGVEVLEVQGKRGNDFISALGGFDTGGIYPGRTLILGADGNDSLSGGTATDEIRGFDGDDVLFGGGGLDFLHGEAGNDVMSGYRGRDRLFGGPDHDDLRGQRGDDRLEGDAGRDNLRGHQGPDLLLGGEHADDLNGGPDTDACDGGPDIDRLTQCEKYRRFKEGDGKG
jgi:Ca2+-binding RTX toxin-like protein